jgi:hypothetical protein
MKIWKETKTIESVLGEKWNLKGHSCYHGFEATQIDGDIVHKTQVIQPSGGKLGNNQRLLDSGEVEVTIPKTNQESMELYENDYLHGVEFDCFIGASVTETVMKEKRVRGPRPGTFFKKQVPIEQKVPGYKHAVVKIFEAEDLGDSVRFTYGPVAA